MGRIDDLLRFDALDTAERVTGKSYKEDASTMGLGVMLQMSNEKEKRILLEGNDDTTFTNTVENYIRILRDIGFEEVKQYHFEGRDGYQEILYIFWDAKRGILLRFDTYKEDQVNSAKMYYNWLPHDETNAPWHIRGGGHYVNDVWIGDKDAREALRHVIHKHEEYGSFVLPWVAGPRFYLVGYNEFVNEKRPLEYFEDRKQLSYTRFLELPIHVRMVAKQRGERP